MKRPQNILNFILIVALSSYHALAQTNNTESRKVSLFNDSIHSSLRLVDETFTNNTYNTLILELDKQTSFEEVYELSFYHQLEQESMIEISYYSGSNWSQKMSTKVSGNGYKKLPISILNTTSNIISSDVQKIKISIQSPEKVIIDELAFSYLKTPKENLTRGISKDRQLEISKQIKQQNKLEEKAKSKIANKRNKEKYGKENSKL